MLHNGKAAQSWKLDTAGAVGTQAEEHPWQKDSLPHCLLPAPGTSDLSSPGAAAPSCRTLQDKPVPATKPHGPDQARISIIWGFLLIFQAAQMLGLLWQCGKEPACAGALRRGRAALRKNKEIPFETQSIISNSPWESEPGNGSHLCPVPKIQPGSSRRQCQPGIPRMKWHVPKCISWSGKGGQETQICTDESSQKATDTK